MSKTLPLLLLLSPILASAAEEAPAIPFTALVRQDGAEPVTVEVDVPAGSVETVALDNGMLLEFTAPADPLDYAMVRLLGKRGADDYPLHITRQPLEDNSKLENNATPRNGYLICDGKVAFFSPVGESLPRCPGGRGS